MLSFVRPSRSAKEGGEKLPMPFKSLEQMGASLRRSEVSMLAGTPGSGKSSLALSLAIKAQVPALYVAADTSEWTMRVRTLAALSGKDQAICEKALLDEPDESWFSGANHIAWSFDSSPSIEQIRLELDAYDEVHGTVPHLIVVDNLIDVAQNAGDEWAALRATMKDLKVLARDTRASVLVLHHVSEADVRKFRSSFAPPRYAIQGKVSQLPALVLTLDSTAPHTMHLGIVKNRYGQASENGSYGPALQFNPSTMQISDHVVRF